MNKFTFIIDLHIFTKFQLHSQSQEEGQSGFDMC